MHASDDDNRYAPPQAPVSDIQPSTEAGILASRSRRLGAGLLDTALIIALVWLVSKFTPWNLFGLATSGAFADSALSAFGSFVCFVLLQGYLLATRGQTIGKAALGTRIVRVDGSPASLGRVLGLRYALGSAIGIIPFVGQLYALLDCVLIFRKSHQCLHDQIADTVVIRI